MADYTLNFAVEIDLTDHTTDTDSTQGLYSGYLRWVTGRPSYDGVTVVPTGDNNSNVWGEGFLLYDGGIGMPDRIIDLILGGDYTGLSGFDFIRENVSNFELFLNNGPYYIINRPIKFYYILDDEFIQVWGGVVAKREYNDTDFKIICEDIFESQHKTLPPQLVTENNFPDADNDNNGKVVPVVFGDVLRSPVLNISGRNQKQKLGIWSTDNRDIYVAKATAAALNGDGNLVLTLRTPNVYFSADHFLDNGDYWIRVIKGDEQSIYILGNSATSGTGDSATTDFELSKFLDGPDDLADLQDDIAGTNGYDLVWWYEILKMDSTNLISEKPIADIPQDSSSRYTFVQYNTDKERYIDVNELVLSAVTTNTEPIAHPHLKLINNDLDIDGTFTRLIPIVPAALALKNVSIGDSPSGAPSPDYVNDFNEGDLSALLDKDRTTSLGVHIDVAPSLYNGDVTIEIYVDLPKDYVKNGTDELFLCADITTENDNVDNNVMDIIITPIDAYGSEITDYETNNTFPGRIPYATSYNYNFLPNEYYRGGDDNGEKSLFGSNYLGEKVSPYLQISQSAIDAINKTTAINRFLLTITLRKYDTGQFSDVKELVIREIGFFAKQTMNVKNESQFIKAKGEYNSAAETNNVYRALRHILEDYDGFSALDFDNVSTYRANWPVGRALTERKKSSEYLKELCRSSFVAMFPDRYGNRKTRAFMELSTLEFTHSDTNGTILDDKITGFRSSDPADVFNEFELQFDYDPGSKKYNRNLFITNIGAGATFPTEDESTGTDTSRSFTSVENYGGNNLTPVWIAEIVCPSTPTWAVVGEKVSFTGPTIIFKFAEIVWIAGNSVWVDFYNNYGSIKGNLDTTGTLTSHSQLYKAWTKYVGGINDYVTAAEYWQICQDSYARTKTINKFPESLSKLDWFHDTGPFDGNGPSFDTSAHRYLALLVQWATREKDVVSYSIPLTPDNLKLEFMSYGQFRDTIYTNNVYKNGYITKIKLMPDRIDLEVTLVPASVASVPTNTLYIETGSAPDTIPESGSETDQIEEQGVS